MKGIVFNELIQLIESIIGEVQTEHLLEDADLNSGGSYTSVGTYDHKEALSIVQKFSKLTQSNTDQLLISFGRHLGKVFVVKYPDFYKHKNVFFFLQSLDSYIHVSVKKLYPDAELPSFNFEMINDKEMLLTYQSVRPFAPLAQGLILETISYFGQKESLTILNSGKNENGHFALFKITQGCEVQDE